MTDEHEHAMNVWWEAFAAWDDTPADPNAMHSGDQAAAAVIAADRAGLVAEVERLRYALEVCAAELYAPYPECSCHICPPCKDCVDYGSIREAIDIARAALKEPSHDA